MKCQQDIGNDVHCGFVAIRATDIDGIRGIKQVEIRMADDKIYGSVERDSLDRAFVSWQRWKPEFKGCFFLSWIAIKTPRLSVQM